MGRNNIFSKLVSSCFDVKTSNFNLFYQKKAISPVVATALLLVVAVVAVVGFQNWFQTYQSSMFTKVEQDSSAGSMNTLIDTVIGSNLYFRNGYTNLTISDIKVDGTSCLVPPSTYSSGLKEIDIGNCNQNATSSVPEIVVITDKGVFSKKIYLRGVTTTSSGTSSLSCPTGYIPVPGSSTYGTSDFCVMKYEAKEDSSGLCLGGDTNNCPQSIASGNPWVSITWQNAQIECDSLNNGTGNYHLITDNEWLTIANNVVSQNNNWDSGIVGTGGVFRGNVNLNDAISCGSSSFLDGNTAGTNCVISGGIHDGRNKRTLILSNGEVIWDFSGNVFQWVNDSIAAASRYHGGNQSWMSYTSDDGTGKIASLVPALKSPPTGWNSNQGMGRYYDGGSLAGAFNSLNQAPDFCTGYCSPTAVFLRGGRWNYGAGAGAFSLFLGNGPSYASALAAAGFRCSYAP